MSHLSFRCDHEGEASDDGESDNNSSTSTSTNNSSNSNSKNSGNNRSNIMCRKGTFRGTVFFIAEGHGDVVVGAQDDESVGLPRGQGGDGGGSSTESLLAATAFGNRRSCTEKHKRNHPQRGDEKGGGANSERLGDGHHNPVEHAKVGATTKMEPEPAAGVMATRSGTGSEHKQAELASDDQKALAPAGGHPTGPHADDSHETVQGQSSQVSPSAAVLPISLADGERKEWDSGGSGEEERCPRLTALRRGDFFGVDPVLPSAAASSERASIAADETTH